MSENESNGLILLLIGLAFYFLPTIVACMRDRASDAGAVFLVNLLLGWTVVGWVVSFIWACWGRTSAGVRRRKQQHRGLLTAAPDGSLKKARDY